MATYEVEFDRKQRMYPILYDDDNGGEASLLHHLFFVNGNGYEWQNGELVDIDDDYTEERLLDREEEGRADAKELRDMWLDWRSEWLGGVETRQRKIEFDESLTDTGIRPLMDYDDPPEHLLAASKKPRKIYPICEYAKCSNVPDDIKPDWLVAAFRALAAGRGMIRTERDDEYLAAFEQRINEL